MPTTDPMLILPPTTTEILVAPPTAPALVLAAPTGAPVLLGAATGAAVLLAPPVTPPLLLGSVSGGGGGLTTALRSIVQLFQSDGTTLDGTLTMAAGLIHLLTASGVSLTLEGAGTDLLLYLTGDARGRMQVGLQMRDGAHGVVYQAGPTNTADDYVEQILGAVHAQGTQRLEGRVAHAFIGAAVPEWQWGDQGDPHTVAGGLGLYQRYGTIRGAYHSADDTPGVTTSVGVGYSADTKDGIVVGATHVEPWKVVFSTDGDVALDSDNKIVTGAT